ncbi:urease subunit beta [Staphylococcus sp. SQ8-PEA]|uniref:Urease subunit beta n=1 Tax=Staphylococcus marylandisciuri TaxID=2981529 RepID=A0ABT2QN75_9STAP|nr:urease subunit beta [Staphylococcus marylandisciuri]MCU5745404.1 urease subunit beta [Staphylococcus marylandisciuri]
MKPGDIKVKNSEITINQGHHETRLTVKNSGDRPVQVGSHYHFYEANPALQFDRDKSYGKHLDIPAGAAVRFEPGDEKDVQLIEYGGQRRIYGFHGVINSEIDESRVVKPTDDDNQEDSKIISAKNEGTENANKESGYNQ